MTAEQIGPVVNYRFCISSSQPIINGLRLMKLIIVAFDSKHALSLGNEVLRTEDDIAFAIDKEDWEHEGKRLFLKDAIYQFILDHYLEDVRILTTDRFIDRFDTEGFIWVDVDYGMFRRGGRRLDGTPHPDDPESTKEFHRKRGLIP